MSPSSTNLKVSFENAILKIPKYSLETSLYEALVNKMVERPLKLSWNSNDVLVYTIGSGVTQDIINLHCKPTRIFVGVLGKIASVFENCTALLSLDIFRIKKISWRF